MSELGHVWTAPWQEPSDEKLPSGGFFVLVNVRFAAHTGLKSDITPCPFGAIKRLMHRSKLQSYSITSSARASRVGGTARPSALAVLRLMTSSKVVGSWTGRSAGLAP